MVNIHDGPPKIICFNYHKRLLEKIKWIISITLHTLCLQMSRQKSNLHFPVLFHPPLTEKEALNTLLNILDRFQVNDHSLGDSGISYQHFMKDCFFYLLTEDSSFQKLLLDAVLIELALFTFSSTTSPLALLVRRVGSRLQVTDAIAKTDIPDDSFLMMYAASNSAIWDDQTLDSSSFDSDSSWVFDD